VSLFELTATALYHALAFVGILTVTEPAHWVVIVSAAYWLAIPFAAYVGVQDLRTQLRHDRVYLASRSTSSHTFLTYGGIFNVVLRTFVPVVNTVFAIGAVLEICSDIQSYIARVFNKPVLSRHKSS
jgi:hypothetical protein